MEEFNSKPMRIRIESALKNLNAHYSYGLMSESKRAALKEKFFADKWKADHVVQQALIEMRR